MQERLERIKQHMRSMHVLDMRQLSMASEDYNPHASSESAWERHAISVRTLTRGNTSDTRGGNRAARTSGPSGCSSSNAPPTFLRGQMRLKSIKGPSKLMKGLSLAFRDVTAGGGGIGSGRGLDLLLAGDGGDDGDDKEDEEDSDWEEEEEEAEEEELDMPL